MSAGIHHLKLEQGGRFERQVTVTDSAGDAIDISGYTFEMYLKEYKGGSNVLSTASEVTITIVTAASGIFKIEIDESDLNSTTETNGVYDLYMDDGDANGPIRLLEGTWVLSLLV